MTKHVTEHKFTDPLDGTPRILSIDDRKTWHDGGVGVLHTGCPELAAVHPDLDCWFCTACGVHGRVPGAWVIDCVEAP